MMQKKKKFIIKDGGARQKFASGMVREPNAGRGRFDLISPIGLQNLAIHMEGGAIKKYEDRNWEKGGPLSMHLNSALRHLNQFLSGNRTEDHLSACVFNCFAIEHNLEMIERGMLPPELNDLPNYLPEVQP